MNKYSLHTLTNGLQVMLVPNKSTQAVTVLVLIKVGSRQESASLNGAAHFVEHMMFKGTKKRPQPVDIPVELEGVGADYNAFTGKEYTGYYIKLAADKLELALDILSDMMLTSKFSSSELERERGVILEEINMYEDSPRATVDNLYESLVYQGHSLARPISGPKKVIRSISRAELLKYKNEFYYGANSVVAVAGNIENTRLRQGSGAASKNNKTIKLVEKYFKQFNSSKTEKPIINFKNKQNSSRVKIKNKKTEQIHLALGFPSFADEDPKSRAAKLLSVILGGGMSSRLFIEAREKRGLCYSIFSTATTYEDTGDFMIKAGLDSARLEPAIKLILSELKKLKTKQVTAGELKKAKEYIKGTSILSLEDSEAQAGFYAREVIFGEKILTPAQKLNQIDKVTSQQIRSVASEIFQQSKLNLALIGPFKSSYKAKLERLLVV
jgi:predicted Zn-dependent peptidase